MIQASRVMGRDDTAARRGGRSGESDCGDATVAGGDARRWTAVVACSGDDGGGGARTSVRTAGCQLRRRFRAGRHPRYETRPRVACAGRSSRCDPVGRTSPLPEVVVRHVQSGRDVQLKNLLPCGQAVVGVVLGATLSQLPERGSGRRAVRSQTCRSARPRRAGYADASRKRSRSSSDSVRSRFRCTGTRRSSRGTGWPRESTRGPRCSPLTEPCSAPGSGASRKNEVLRTDRRRGPQDPVV